MKSSTLMATVAAIFVLTQSAHAHAHAYHRHYAVHYAAHRQAMRQQFMAEQDRPWAWHSSADSSWRSPSWGSAGRGSWESAPWQTSSHSVASRYRSGLGGRPAAWCGWEMRQLVGGDPGPQYNLARNWSHWGHAGPPGVGAVVVWAHHVGKIVGQENGHWLIESGNDGHAVRTRPLPIAGAIAIRWG